MNRTNNNVASFCDGCRAAWGFKINSSSSANPFTEFQHGHHCSFLVGMRFAGVGIRKCCVADGRRRLRTGVSGQQGHHGGRQVALHREHLRIAAELHHGAMAGHAAQDTPRGIPRYGFALSRVCAFWFIKPIVHLEQCAPASFCSLLGLAPRGLAPFCTCSMAFKIPYSIDSVFA